MNPRNAGKPLTQFVDAYWIARQYLGAEATGLSIDLAQFAHRKLSQPALCNVHGRPVGSNCRIDVRNQVQMFAHHRVGVDAHGEAFGQIQQACFNPVPAVPEVASAERIESAEEGAPHASTDAVVSRERWGRRAGCGVMSCSQ